jgi:protein-L-isoaspartate O-methyltransferase
MVLPMGPSPHDQWLWRLTRNRDAWERERLTPVRFVPLVPEPPPANETLDVPVRE